MNLDQFRIIDTMPEFNTETTIDVRKTTIVSFRMEIPQDYHCQEMSQSFCVRYDSEQKAIEAAKIYINLPKERRYKRQATVFNGWLISCPAKYFFEKYL